MRIYLHIGMAECGGERIQEVLDTKRDQLAGKGVLYPRSPGRRNHTRLYMAVTDPDHLEPLRLNRGFAEPGRQARLREEVARDLADEAARHDPGVLILSASQLCTLHRRSELERLRALLLPLSEDIRIVAHVDEAARVLVRHYAEALMSGRTASLEQELALTGAGSWRAAALNSWGRINPPLNDFPEVQAPPFWLDYGALVEEWEAVFGAGSVSLRAYDPALFASETLAEEIRGAFGIEGNIGKADPAGTPEPPSAAFLTRARLLNEVLVKLLGTGRIIPRQLWRRILGEISVSGKPIAAESLSNLSKMFEKDNKALLKSHPELAPNALKCGRAAPDWAEAEPTRGFRASQYAAAFLPRIDQTSTEVRKAGRSRPDGLADAPVGSALSPSAAKLMSDRAKENFHELRTGRFAPHNRLGRVNEEELAAAFAEVPLRTLPAGNSGNVIVGCMKNEAPYILEWVAYHRMIGVDNFIIYTNGCEDGTDEILGRLQEMGIVQHRLNDDWKGNSPQQHALNKSLKEPVIRNAEWVIHIDVDEFINIRCGNGTLQDFLDRVPDATNVAMTWRLFGHNDVREFSDAPVIEQFDTAAPKFCPKPHTVWGFKTMVKNIGAYEKLSCHRPNKLRDTHRAQVKWVNGSGQEMTDSYKEKGWRSDLKTIGYDLLQLNHYALRSAESFLIKRQRGRALHVDRSIGINYWVRMDWGGNKDITIKRNVPRLRAEMDRLLADAALRKWHEHGVAWHKTKAAELHATPEFQELYAQALETRLTEMERVAFALALDMEN
jgi:hypothetical protein